VIVFSSNPPNRLFNSPYQNLAKHLEKSIHLCIWRVPSSISSGAEYVTLRKYLSHPSSVMYSFATPPKKLNLGQQIGGGLLIANRMDQWFRWADQKHWAALRSYLLHSFLQVNSAAAPRTSHGNLRNYAKPKPISWVKPVQFGFSSSICTMHDHITEHRWRCSYSLQYLSLKEEGHFMPTP
jgi:hypothetical protein